MVLFKARIQLFQKRAEHQKGRLHPASSGYSPQINFDETLMGCIIESIEEYFHLEKEYDVDVVIPLGKNISVEWYQYGNRFKLNEGGRIVGEGVISGEVCFD